MKIFKILTIFLFIQFSIFSQEAGNQQTEPEVQVEAGNENANENSNQATTNEGNQSEVSLKPISPVPYYDDRLSIGEISFYKKYESKGQGEILDIIIPLKNNSNDDINYKAYVLVVNEFDIHKRMFPGPDYKNWIYYKEQIPNLEFIENINLIPFKEIDTKTILGDKKYNEIYKNYNKKIDQGIIPIYPVNATFHEAVDYLIKNHDKALKFSLQGYDYPKKDFDKNENRTVFKKRFETIVTTHHYYPYKEKDMRYNKVLVLLFNDEENSNLNGRLVYKKVIDLNKLKPVQ